MLYLDSWVWLEYGFEGDLWEVAEELIETAVERSAVFSTIGLAEVDYVLQRDVDRETADFVTSAIEDLDGVHVVPVTSEIALYGSQLRSKYYSRRERELSYADAIHIATAVLTDCDVIHTGDADFDDLDEIETVVHQ